MSENKKSAPPNAAARAKMRILAADLRTIVEINKGIAQLFQQTVAALEQGDLAAAVDFDRQVIAEAKTLDDRHEVAFAAWEAIEMADPVAWSDAAPRDVEPEEEEGDEPPESLLDVISRGLSKGLAAALNGQQGAITLMNINAMSIEDCRKLIAEHSARCRDPNCAVVPLAKERIAKLGGIP